ncbi:cupin domain-containing protein [Saccharospirillum impatiens]|uniref:cupin domain-containing protein n=1 Tax=Saccharospirillum impatiens TaxID=169438 RepID=UPI00042624E8|nr:cupin domain-containing protein [Saccharospirillum impatiens]
MDMLGGLSGQEFLSQYWQKTPYLVRQAFPDGLYKISGDELAGLATEPDVESRLVTANDWTLRHGPFFEEDFTRLPEKDWTLLVQAVDHWVPDIAALFDAFDFIPAWRMDDIMISYAVPGGGVGPHFDHYDVFLIQVDGEREWRIGQSCTDADDRRDDTDLSILAHFDEQERWVLKPGDMLYVPPGIAHWGSALSKDCITYSIGFRAPSQAETLVEFAQFAADSCTDFDRYQDADLKARTDSHLITDADIDRIQQMLQTLTEDRDAMARWFGRYMTQPKYGDAPLEEPTLSNADIARQLQRQPLIRNSAVRLAYQPGILFVDGEAIDSGLPADGLRWICEQKQISASDLGNQDDVARLKVLTTLVGHDAFYFDNE